MSYVACVGLMLT